VGTVSGAQPQPRILDHDSYFECAGGRHQLRIDIVDPALEVFTGQSWQLRRRRITRLDPRRLRLGYFGVDPNAVESGKLE
jgi:hypothetical protein